MWVEAVVQWEIRIRGVPLYSLPTAWQWPVRGKPYGTKQDKNSERSMPLHTNVFGFLRVVMFR